MSSRRLKSLHTSLMALIALLMVMMTVLLTVVVGDVAKRQVALDQGQILAGVAVRLADGVDQNLVERWLDIQNLAQSNHFRDGYTSSPLLRAELDLLRTTHPEYAWIGFAAADGQVRLATAALLEGVDVSSRPWFSAALDAPYIGDPHDAELLQKSLGSEEGVPLRFVDIAAPVFSRNGEVVGVLAAHLHASWIERVIRHFQQRSDMVGNLGVAVFDGRGRRIFGASRHDVDVVANALSNNGFFRDGNGHLVGYANVDDSGPTAGLNWQLQVIADQNALLAPLWALQWRMTLIGLSCAAVMLLVSHFFMHQFSRPIRRLAAHVAAAGDISDLQRIPVKAVFREFADLTRTIENLARRQQEGEREIARQIVEGAQQKQVIRDLEISANTDPLTGALNRRAFNRLLRDALKKASDSNPVALVLLDLDHFKRINDLYGHGCGDQVLVEMCGAVQGHIRSVDSFARIGGEEFALILAGLNQGAVMELLERLRQFIENLLLESENGEAIAVTASFGVSWVRNAQVSSEAALARADEALYAAKAGGRNCIISSSIGPNIHSVGSVDAQRQG